MFIRWIFWFGFPLQQQMHYKPAKQEGTVGGLKIKAGLPMLGAGQLQKRDGI